MSGSVVFPGAARVICRRQPKRPEEKTHRARCCPSHTEGRLFSPSDPGNSGLEILSVRTGADWSGLERTGADIGTAPAGGDAIFAPASEEKSAMASWNGLVVRPSIGEDGELSEPEAPAGARFPLPALPARAELRDAEVHAMLGELDFGECAVMGDATAEERQAIANFDIRAFA